MNRLGVVVADEEVVGIIRGIVVREPRLLCDLIEESLKTLRRSETSDNICIAHVVYCRSRGPTLSRLGDTACVGPRASRPHCAVELNTNRYLRARHACS